MNEPLELHEEHDGLESEASGHDCVTRGDPLVLHCFPAHGVNLTPLHKDELDRLANRIRNDDIAGRATRRIHIVGHSAEWWNITAEEYLARSIARARAAKQYLDSKLKGYMLSHRPTITIEGHGIEAPLVDNMRNSTTRAAQHNRALNRRIEIYLHRAKPQPGPRPKPPDKPVETDWEAFLDTKLRQLGEYFDVQRPFEHDTVYACVRKKLLRKGVVDVVAIGIPKIGEYDPPARGGFLKTESLRDLMIQDLKKGYARGKITVFWRRFRIHVDNARDALYAINFRASGQDMYDRRWLAVVRSLRSQSRRQSHVYSCPFFRSIIDEIHENVLGS